MDGVLKGIADLGFGIENNLGFGIEKIAYGDRWRFAVGDRSHDGGGVQRPPLRL